MLLLKPGCECCDADLPPASPNAMICSFECTFCHSCAEGILGGRCPNCGGEFAAAAGPASGEAGAVSGVAPARVQAGRLPAPLGRAGDRLELRHI